MIAPLAGEIRAGYIGHGLVGAGDVTVGVGGLVVVRGAVIVGFCAVAKGFSGGGRSSALLEQLTNKGARNARSIIVGRYPSFIMFLPNSHYLQVEPTDLLA